MPWLEPVSFTGAHVRLEPLAHEHRDGLIEAVKDGELWHLWYTAIPSPENMDKEIDRRLGLQKSGSMLPFTVFDADGRIAGMTTFMNVDAVNRRVEIGSTWYAKRVQRTGLNTEAKMLLLTHAFEVLDCYCVQIRTDFLNRQSRAAIERLGARMDGVIRGHVILNDGHYRDSVLYSILEHEWPGVKRNIAALMARYEGRGA